MKRQVKILVEGASGTGKTTLVNELSNFPFSGSTIYSVKEIARSLISAGVTYGAQTSACDYYLYFSHYLSSFRQTYNGVVLYDRSIIDAVVYSQIGFGIENRISKLGIEIFKTIKNDIDGIIYLPIEFDLKNATSNLEKSTARKEFDKKIFDFISNCGIVFNIISGSIIERTVSSIKFIETVCANVQD